MLERRVADWPTHRRHPRVGGAPVRSLGFSGRCSIPLVLACAGMTAVEVDALRQADSALPLGRPQHHRDQIGPGAVIG